MLMGMGTPQRRSEDFKNFKPFHQFALVIEFCAALMIVYIFYLLFWPNAPLLTIKQPVHVQENQVEAGSNITWDVNFCMKSNKQFTATRFLERESDGEEFLLQSNEPLSYPVGCHIQTRSIPIPAETDTGKYRLKVIDSYLVNQLKRGEVIFYSEYFQVNANPKVKSTPTLPTNSVTNINN